MIAADSSTLVAYLAGGAGRDVNALDAALAENQVALPPVVVTEILSAPNASDEVTQLIGALPMLAVGDGYWERAGELRRQILRAGRRARLADTLICQSCLDYGIALITRDTDFKQFERHGGLTLA